MKYTKHILRVEDFNVSYILLFKYVVLRIPGLKRKSPYYYSQMCA